MLLFVFINCLFSVFASCSIHLPDSVLGSVEVLIPFCRSCRRHRVLDVIFLLDSNATNLNVHKQLSLTVGSSGYSKLLSSFHGDEVLSSPEVIIRYAVVAYALNENQHLRLSLVQDFTVNKSSTYQALELLQPQAETLFDSKVQLVWIIDHILNL